MFGLSIDCLYLLCTCVRGGIDCVVVCIGACVCVCVRTELRGELADFEGNYKYAHYSFFSVGSSRSNYTL